MGRVKMHEQILNYTQLSKFECSEANRIIIMLYSYHIIHGKLAINVTFTGQITHLFKKIEHTYLRKQQHAVANHRNEYL